MVDEFPGDSLAWEAIESGAPAQNERRAGEWPPTDSDDVTIPSPTIKGKISGTAG